MSKLVVLLLCAFVPALAVAQIDQTQASEVALRDQVEVRTLRSGSAIRSRLEAALGKGRVAEDVTVSVVMPRNQEGSASSIIDWLERSASNKNIITDPGSDPIEPNGPGGVRGQRTSTQQMCAYVSLEQGSAPANITWNWTWRPQQDTNGDGKRDNKDSCPCAWELDSYQVEFSVQGEPLEC